VHVVKVDHVSIDRGGGGAQEMGGTPSCVQDPETGVGKGACGGPNMRGAAQVVDIDEAVRYGAVVAHDWRTR
jgi:hypothetical protein